ncbi:hypothetical protein J6590_011199 [Homalodisca vitripennis]|nr:hypothetical protein J6590_011199 [Homalodisca vitripennis]
MFREITLSLKSSAFSVRRPKQHRTIIAKQKSPRSGEKNIDVSFANPVVWELASGGRFEPMNNNSTRPVPVNSSELMLNRLRSLLSMCKGELMADIQDIEVKGRDYIKRPLTRRIDNNTIQAGHSSHNSINQLRHHRVSVIQYKHRDVIATKGGGIRSPRAGWMIEGSVMDGTREGIKLVLSKELDVQSQS